MGWAESAVEGWAKGGGEGEAVGKASQLSADRMIPISVLRNQFGERFGAQAVESRPAMVGADELYERAMKTTVQVLVTRP